jgi:flagellar hook assembly protein FlgD
VSIPLVVPTAGGEARIEVVNSAGQRVRLLDLGTLAAGTPVTQWDGRNESGRDVAAGVYTAWLIAGSTRIAIRLLRVP